MFPSFKTQDEIPEAFRDHYEEKDGEWVAKAPKASTDGPTQDDIDKLKEAARKERDLTKAAEARAREIEAELATLKQESEAKKVGLNDEQLKKLRADVRADIEKEYATKPLSELPESWTARTEAQTALLENRTLKLDSQVKKIALEAGEVRGERVENWWRQFGDEFDLTDDGKPMVKNHPGKEVAEYIKTDLKKALPDFYVGTQAAGGGVGGIQRDGKLVAGTSADDVLKNPGEALRAARSAGA